MTRQCESCAWKLSSSHTLASWHSECTSSSRAWDCSRDFMPFLYSSSGGILSFIPSLNLDMKFQRHRINKQKKHVTTQCPSLYHQDSSVSCAGSEATAIEKSHWLSERAKNMYEIVRTWKWILVAVQITAGPEGSPSRSLDRKINIVTCCEIRPNNTAVFYLFNAKGQARDVCKLSGSLNIRSPAYHMYNHGHIIYRHYKNS